MKSVAIAVVLFGFAMSSAAEAACVIHFNRTACPGKEFESYSKCGGAKECDQEDAAATVEACTAAANKACENSRLDITKSKVITAKFDGKPLKGGANFCASNRPDFNKCGN